MTTRLAKIAKRFLSNRKGMNMCPAVLIPHSTIEDNVGIMLTLER
jgi:hypothetical protein